MSSDSPNKSFEPDCHYLRDEQQVSPAPQPAEPPLHTCVPPPPHSPHNPITNTLVAPPSPRPAPGAPVSAPISWDELDDPELRPDRFTIRTIGHRLAERGDLFRGVLYAEQRLPRLH